VEARPSRTTVITHGTALTEALRVMNDALPKGIPLMLTRGFVRPPSVIPANDHAQLRRNKRKANSPPSRVIAFEQAVPLPEEPGLGSLTQACGIPQCLAKPFEIHLADDDRPISRRERAIEREFRTQVLHKDALLLSVDRLRTVVAGDALVPSSIPIVIEAIDPLTGASLWKNPLLPIEEALRIYASAPTAMDFSEQGERKHSDRASDTVVPDWYRTLKTEAQEFYIDPDRIHGFIVQNRVEQLLETGIPFRDAVAQAEQETSRIEFPTGMSLPAWFMRLHGMAQSNGIGITRIHSFIVRKRTQQLETTGLETSEAMLEAEREVTACLSALPNFNKPGKVRAPDGPLPEVITWAHLLDPRYRAGIQERVEAFIGMIPGREASTRTIKVHLGIPEGSEGHALKMGSALQRNILSPLVKEGRIIPQGATRDRYYTLPRKRMPR